MPDEAVVVDADGHTMEPDDLWTDAHGPRRGGATGSRARSSRTTSTRPTTPAAWCAAAVASCRTDGRRGRHDPASSSTTCSQSAAASRAATTPTPASPTWTPTASTSPWSTRRTAMFFGPCDPIEAFHDVEFVADCQRAVQRLGRRVLRCDPTRLFGDRRRAAPGRRARGRWKPSAVQRARAARRVRPPVGVRRRAAAQPLRLRPVLGRRARTSTSRWRSTPACTSTRRARAASSASSPRART